MAVLEQLEPGRVFYYFEQICSIPHGSGNVEQISNYLAGFAKERGLEYYQDKTRNVVMIKEATAGYEEAEPIILQGHMDMVAVKKPDCPIDMEKEGLQVQTDGEKIYAKGTSLGGDDGIAVAYALALLESEDIPHPRLEVVLTTEEETGMDGAMAVDLSMLKGHMMINLDSEEEGTFLTSCAGGTTVECTIEADCEKKEGLAWEIVLKGLQGGHSGMEIQKEHANSNVLMGRLMSRLLGKADYSIASIEGGMASNAIPRETKALFVVEENSQEVFLSKIKEYETILQKEYAVKDKDIRIDCTQKGKGSYEVLTQETLKRVAAMIFTQPNGVQAMSADIKGLVQTSLNLGILKWKAGVIEAAYAIRSSMSSECEMLAEKITLSCEMLGAKAKILGTYPGWEYKQDSVLRERMIAVYKEMYQKEPQVEAIHAGLECGILAGKIEGLDCVSIGPDMKDVHTTEESLNIASTGRVWEFVMEVLKRK